MCRGSSERMGINYRYAHVLIKSETNHQMSRTTIMYLNTIEVNVFSIARNRYGMVSILHAQLSRIKDIQCTKSRFNLDLLKI